MPTWALPAATPAAAAGLSYLCCVRPMLPDCGHVRSSRRGGGAARGTNDLDAQLGAARTEVDRLER